MTAKITMEFDDQTAPGFQSLVKSLQSSDQAAQGLAVATNQDNEALRILQEQNLQTVAAIEKTTAAVQANRDSFFEAANSAIEFTGHLAKLGVVGVVGVAKLAKGSALGEIESRFNLGALAAKQLALRVVGIAAPVAVATASFKLMNVILEHTGEKVIAVDKAHQDLADQINRGSKTMQQVMEETGKSFEELGLKAQNNWDIIREESAKTAEQAKSDFLLIASEGAKLTGIPQAAKAAWEGVDKFATEQTQHWKVGMEVIREGMDDLMGRSTELRKTQEKLAEQAAFEAPIRKRFKLHRESIEREIELEKELSEFKNISTHDDLDRALSAERAKLDTALRTKNLKEGYEEAYQKKFEALMRRHQEIDKETAEAEIKNAREVAEAAAKAEKERLDAARKRAEEEDKIREEAAKAEYELQEETARGQEELALQERNNSRERQIERLKRTEGNEGKITEILKRGLEERAELENHFAQSATEAERIEWQLRRDLRELDHQHAIEAERKKAELRQKAIEDAREKFETEVDLLKNKLMEEKKLREGGTSQSDFKKIVGSFDSQRVREEIVQNRLEAGARSGRDGKGRKLTEAEIRRMVIREMQSGGLDQKEVQAAQLDLVQKTAVTGLKTGKLAKTMAIAMHQVASNAERTNADIEKHDTEIEELTRIIKGDSDGTARRQAQRRGSRR